MHDITIKLQDFKNTQVKNTVNFCVYITYSLTHSLTYLLTPWCRVLLEKLTGLQLVKKFPEFHRTRRYITVLTSVRQLSLSWASPIQSIYPHPTSWRSVLILSTHQRLGLSSFLFPSGFPTKTPYTPFSTPIHATCSSSCSLLHSPVTSFLVFILHITKYYPYISWRPNYGLV